MKGRQNISLLCKNDITVSFLETLKAVQEKGSLELAILFLTTQHLFLSIDQAKLPKEPGELDTNRNYDYIVGMEHAACLLSQRHASRQGDDIVIWSLLCDMDACMTAEEFWLARVDTLVNTGFLMSNVPRLSGHKGLTWAPDRPGFPVGLADVEVEEKAIHVYDGSHTFPGFIVNKITLGLWAKWWMYAFKFDDESNTGAVLNLIGTTEGRFLTSEWLVDRSLSPRLGLHARMKQIGERYLQGEYRIAALLQPCGKTKGYEPVQYQGETEGRLLAVLTSSDGFIWTWRGVYEWNEPVSLPLFRLQELLLT